VKAMDVLTVLKACPALTHLHIEINWLENNKRGRQYVDSAVYGDEFWEAVAEHCPHLESIEMMDGSTYQNFNMLCIAGVSDRTLQAFASLKSLRSIEFSAARVTGEGIFEWLSRVTKLTEPIGVERMLGIRLGGHQRTRLAPPRFYAEIVAFLKLLSETSEEALGAAACGAKPLLFLVNPYESKVSRAWSEPYMRDHLRPLLEAVTAKHPSLGLSVSLFGRNGDKFNRIETLTLDWRKGERERELFSDNMEEDDERDTYRDAARYEFVSDNEGDEVGEEDEDEGDVSVEDLLLWRVIMGRFLYNEDEDD
jgi:hypothetical protein